MTTGKFVPGEVTPRQLEEYRQEYEAAKLARQQALYRYESAYRVYSNALFREREAESVYVWAQHGMVEVTA